METMKKNPMEMMEMENAVAEVKNVLYDPSKSLDEETASELEGGPVTTENTVTRSSDTVKTHHTQHGRASPVRLVLSFIPLQ